MEQDNKQNLEITTKNLDPLAFFKNDADFVFAFKKTEKLTTAIYMVTNLFSPEEPMKWTLRKKVSDLLSFVLSYKDIYNGQQKDFQNSAKTRVLEIVSLLEVASLAGLVSSMNHSILKQEFSNLLSALESSGSTKDNSKETFSKTFFEVPRIKSLGESQPSQEFPQTVKDNSRTTDRDTDKQVQKRSYRQTTILNILRKKGELTIKDISAVIKDCSEKTIQRELISFMSLGIVKRVGERRWSRYSLI